MVKKISLQSVSKEIKRVAQGYRLKLVILYGSHARGTAKETSDVDIAILGESPLDLDAVLDITNELSSIFESDDVDVKSLHHTNPFFRYQVTKDGVLLFGKEHDFISFKAYAFRDYVDSQSLLRLKEKLVRERVKNLNAGNL